MYPLVPLNETLQGRAVNVINALDEVKKCIAGLAYLLDMIKDELSTNQQKYWLAESLQ